MARGRGEAGPEWRFRVAIPGEARHPLVPDVAFVDRAKLAGFSRAEIQAPPFAPTIAVEVLSPGDSAPDVASKIDVYLRAGTELVIVIDPSNETFALYDSTGTMRLRAGDRLAHSAMPAFSLDVAAFFAAALGYHE